MAEKVIGKWTDKLREPWDVRDLYSVQDGYPWCNSHYGRHLIFWAIPLALSGQQYDAASGHVSCDPKAGAPAKLPWFTPAAQGALIITLPTAGTAGATVGWVKHGPSRNGALREPVQNSDTGSEGIDSVRNPPFPARFASRTLRLLPLLAVGKVMIKASATE
jgi:hypothetical protein